MKLQISLSNIRSKTAQTSLSASPTSITELEALITAASARYYNDGKFLRINIADKYPAAFKLLEQHFDITGKVQTIDDESFDAFIDLLKMLSPRSTVLKRVGAPVTKTGKPAKRRLKFFMGSLDKIKPEDADSWLRKHPGPYLVSNKLDGASIQLNYADNKVEAFTRGDGTTGQDITHLTPHLKIPQRLKGVIDVRGEVIMSEEAFDARWAKDANKDGFENARNLASGLVNRKEVHKAVKDIDVVVYEMLMPRDVPSDALKKLDALGFKVVPFKVYQTLTAARLQEILDLRRKISKYAIDGLVVMQDKKVALKDDSNPDHAVAFKSAQASDIVQVKVLKVVWTESRGGLLKPVVNIEPVRLGGVTIKQAAGFNAFFIQHGYRYKEKDLGFPEMPIGPGALVSLKRSGDVIPHIIKVLKCVRAQMPDQPYSIQGPEAVMTETSDLSDQKRITHFFDTIGVEGIKLGTVTKLHDAGLDSVIKIVRATKDDFMTVDGIQERTATKLVENIKTALTKTTLPQLMDASGCFGQGIGTRVATEVVKKYPDVLNFDVGSKRLKENIERLTQVPTFSDVRAKLFMDGLPKFIQFYKQLGIKVEAPKTVKKTGSALVGRTVVFTGIRSSELEAKITAQGGTVGSGVSSKTTDLICKDPGEGSAKLVRARELGTSVWTIDSFKKKYQLE